MKKTNEQFVKEINKLVGDEYMFLEEYVTNKTKIKVKHTKCNYSYYVSPNNFLRGCRCPNCNGGVKKDKDSFIKQLRKIDKNYELVGEYINASTKTKILHKVCGNIYESSPTNFIQGHRCPYCFKKIKKTTEQFKQEIKELVGSEYEVIGEYEGNDKLIEIKHNKCNYSHLYNPKTFLFRGYRCPKCSGHLKYSSETFKIKMNELIGNEYQILEDYKDNKTPIRCIHLTCNKEFLMTPHNFLQGHRCPYCSNVKHFSNSEKEILEYVKSILPDEKIEENNRTILNGKEIDIFLPEKNIGFEYNGLYYHSDAFVNNIEKYSIDKTMLAKSKGVYLIHIFEDEWLEKQDIVKDKIKTILCKRKNKCIYARICEIKEISSKQRNEFLNQTHIQGTDKANISLGLFYEEKLVAVLSLCKPRINLGQRNRKKDVYELSRYSSLLGYNIVGGFSKLLKYALKNYNIESIYTYADLRWTNMCNNIYKNNGFLYIGKTKPNYFYIKNNQKRENRFKYRKSELKKIFPDIYSDNKTESEIMNEAGYHKVYDCGTLKYELINPYYNKTTK